MAHLLSLRPSHGDAPAAFLDAVQYQESQRDWIGDSQTWQEQRYSVGSGMVERAVAVVINLRLKKRGMRWKRANSPVLMSRILETGHRVQRINAEWDAAAASHPILGGTTWYCKQSSGR